MDRLSPDQDQDDYAPQDNRCKFLDDQPHHWLSSARYTCRRCGSIDVRYDLQALGSRSYARHHYVLCADGSTARCRGRFVRELMCTYCGIFRRMLAR